MRCLVIGLVLVGSASRAHAGDPKFEFAKQEAADKAKQAEADANAVEWKATAEAGLVFTTGNSETTTVTAGIKASRKAGKDKLSLEGAVAYARSATRALADLDGDGLVGSEAEIATVTSTTAETLAGKVRYDRFLTEHNTLFAALLASRDVPAGKDLVIGAQIGYSRLLHKTKTSEVIGEFGYDFSREDLAVGDPVAIHSARALFGVKSTLSEGVEADGALELLSNLNRETLPTMRDGGAFKDTRINGHGGVTAKLGKSLAVQTTIDAKYDHRPGPLAIKNLAPGFVPEATALDTIMKASLIYTF